MVIAVTAPWATKNMTRAAKIKIFFMGSTPSNRTNHGHRFAKGEVIRITRFDRPNRSAPEKMG
jgi:hypothetical protein